MPSQYEQALRRHYFQSCGVLAAVMTTVFGFVVAGVEIVTQEKIPELDRDFGTALCALGLSVILTVTYVVRTKDAIEDILAHQHGKLHTIASRYHGILWMSLLVLWAHPTMIVGAFLKLGGVSPMLYLAALVLGSVVTYKYIGPCFRELKRYDTDLVLSPRA